MYTGISVSPGNVTIHRYNVVSHSVIPWKIWTSHPNAIPFTVSCPFCSLMPSPDSRERSFPVFPELWQNREALKISSDGRSWSPPIIPRPVRTPRATQELFCPSCVSALTSLFPKGRSLPLPVAFSVLQQTFLSPSSSLSTKSREVAFLSSTGLARLGCCLDLQRSGETSLLRKAPAAVCQRQSSLQTLQTALGWVDGQRSSAWNEEAGKI